MFSIRPSTGTFTFSNMVAALRASISATSCGVVTTIAPARCNGLHNRKLNIAGARRQIEDEHIEFAPFHLPQKLLGVARHHRPAQNRRRAVVEQKSHRHQLQSVLFDRQNAIFFRRHRLFARAEHERNTRAINVAIAETDARAGIVASATARFAATVDLPTPPFPLAMAMMCLIPGIRVAPTPELPTPLAARECRSRLSVRARRQFAQDIFRIGFDCTRHRRVIRCQRKLNDDFAIALPDFFDDPKRNDVPAESGIFHRLQRFFDLFVGDGH